VKAVIIGAGGLGSYVGAVLARAGHDVHLVARGEHASAVRQNGLRVVSSEGEFVVRPGCVGSAHELDGADAAVVTVKSYSLDDVAPQVRHLAERDAFVLPLLNGVDATERLCAAGVPGNALVDGVAYLTSFRTAPGVIERKGTHQRLVVGSASGLAAKQLPRVVELFGDTPVEVRVDEEILPELWRKMAVVCSLSAVCGMTDAAIGRIRAHPLGRDLQERAVGEVMAVGRARGVALPADSETRVHAILDAFPEDFYPSVLHDLRSGRRTEMESLGGTIARLGRQAGVETPLHDAATCAVQLIEAGRK
jgi:2-dehydropantoate 2-reductase